MKPRPNTMAFERIGAIRPYFPCREAGLNWLALGLLLAAWNAVGADDPHATPRRPEQLRRYAHVSVRAAQRLLAPARRSLPAGCAPKGHANVNEL